MIDTPRERLERAFETLKKQGITPILIKAGAPQIREETLADYRRAAYAACTPDSWVGAHAGVVENGGAYWDERTGQLMARHRIGDRNGYPVTRLTFSFPLNQPAVPKALIDALEEQAFYSTWRSTDEDGRDLGPGTDADCVILHLIEEDDL